MSIDGRGRLLYPAEAAEAMGVSVKTLTRWADQGRIGAIRTIGGHRRYWENEILAIRAREERKGRGTPGDGVRRP